VAAVPGSARPSSPAVKKPARGARGAPLPGGQNTPASPHGVAVALVELPAQK
jgi:hypothetical protein